MNVPQPEMKMRTVLLIGVLALLCAGPALASTPDAWAALAGASQKACLASILKQHGNRPFLTSRISGRITGIGGAKADSYYGLTIEWRTRAGNERWLCLYDKKAKAAQAQQVEDIAGYEGN